MLENGAETYRVEDTIYRMCKSKKISNIQTFVIPTGIFISLNYNDELFSYIERVTNIQIDLHIIALVNDFSRKYVKNDISIEDATKELNKISKAPDFSVLTKSIFGGISGGFFSLMFNGNFVEFIIAFITSFFVILSTKKFSKYSNSFFLKHIVGGMVNTFIALMFTEILKLNHIFIDVDKIIIGSIMPLVPGVAFTNAIRDSINGDLVSGASKLLEATIIAVAIAIGVGFTLNLNILLNGGL